MRKIIVTDLTRFSREDIVCTAGIDVDTYECVRPMPYLSSERCKALNILPGAILEGEFSPSNKIRPPHTEDMDYGKLTFLGPCTTEAFENVLVNTLVEGVGQGFGLSFENGQKHIPTEHKLNHSIITIKVRPQDIDIVQHGFKPKKVQVHFTDASRTHFRYISITDLGFNDFAERTYKKKGSLLELNEFISSQNDVYLRIGLSRPYTATDGRQGCWVQCNGIYTFPEFHAGIRSYG